MDQTCIKTFGNILIDLILVKKTVKHLTCRAGQRKHMGLVGKIIPCTHVVIDTYSLIRSIIHGYKRSYPVIITAVQCKKHIIMTGIIGFMFNDIQILKIVKCTTVIFKIQISLYIREILTDIMIQCKG